jgi:hypothetical protein
MFICYIAQMTFTFSSFVFFTGVFGEIKYSFFDKPPDLFTIDADTGEIKVANGAIIDREKTDSIWLRIKAVDTAPPNFRKESAAAVSFAFIKRIVNFQIILI